MKKADKPIFVANLKKELEKASSQIFVDYAGLTVSAQRDLKKRLKQIGGKMLITKNTLLKRAGREAKMQKEAISDTILQGQTAVIVSENDSIAPLQILAKFAIEFETPKLKAGIIDNKFYDSYALKLLSTLPSKEVLLGQVMGSIAGPMYAITGVLRGNLEKLVYILNTKLATVE